MRPSSTLRDSDLILVSRRSHDCLLQEDFLRFEVSDLGSCHLGSLERVVLKHTFFDSTIRKFHAADTILDSTDPFSLVAGSIFPEHLTVAMPFIVLVATFVVVATLPREHAESVLLVVLVGPLVHVAILIVEAFLPLAFAVLEPVFELADVDASVFPLVLTLTFWLSVNVGSRVAITVCEDI